MGKFDGNAIVIDVSSYEKGLKLKPFFDAGATHFILRMGAQKRYEYDNWQLFEDECYRPWYDEAKSLGAKVGGYYLYCAGVDDQNYEASEILLNHMGEIMANGYKPDFLMIDDEVNQWWQSGRTVTATAVNQVKGLRILIDKCWKRFRLVTGHYTRVSFMKQTAEYTREYTTWKDNINRNGTVVPSWYAWYKYFKQSIPMNSLTEWASGLTYPTSTQENSLLNLGSFGLWDLWQIAGDVVTPYGKCDISVSRLPIKEFNALFNITSTTPPQDPPPGGGNPPPSGNPDLAELARRVTTAEAEIAALKAWKQRVQEA